MQRFMDVHRGMQGITEDEVMAAHQADLDVEADENVHFERAWADPTSGMIFCLSTGPSVDAVKRVHTRSGHPTDEIYPVPLEV